MQYIASLHVYGSLKMNILKTFAIIFATMMATVSIHAQDIRDCGTLTDIDGNV